MKRAAYFMSHPDHFGRPFDDGIMRALLAAGWTIDEFDPGGDQLQPYYPQDRLRRLPVEYRSRWLLENLLSARWRSYDLFIGSCDLPMAFAGLLSMRAGRPCVTACDEIYTGGYVGAATRYWKSLSRYGMRRSRFTVITDRVREDLQRDYAALPPGHAFHEYPSCYVEAGDRSERGAARRELGFSDGDFVIELTGQVSAQSGADWMVRAIPSFPDDWKLLIRTGRPTDPLSEALFRQLERDGRIRYDIGVLDWRAASRRAAAGDVGVVIYTQTAPQFQLMGVSSAKLCTHLALGQPVVATWQESFRFLEEYGCGVLVRGEDEFVPALRHIRERYDEMSGNAVRAVAEYVRPAEKLSALTQVFGAFR